MESDDSADELSVSPSAVLRTNGARLNIGARARSRSRDRSPGSEASDRGRAPSPPLNRRGIRGSPPGSPPRRPTVEPEVEPVDRGNNKFRHFVFTWNNYPVNAGDLLTALGSSFLCYQPERGANGTKHLQGKN